MKKSVLLVFLALAFQTFTNTVSAKNEAAPSQDTLRVLAIGNSFSVDAMDSHLFPIAKADGRVIIIGNMYIGGCSLERHYNNSLTSNRDYIYFKIDSEGKHTQTGNFCLEEAFADERWDVVTFQQSSPLSGFYDSYEPFLPAMLDYARRHVAEGTRLMFHQTWTYAAGSDHPNFPDYGCDRGRMYDAIMLASATACGKYGLQVIPAGTAVENFARCYLGGVEDYTRDGYHLSFNAGRYVASCAWYESLTGTSVVGNSYKPAHLRDNQREAAQQAAHLAVCRPFQASELDLPEVYLNEDESKVPEYEIPDALLSLDGKKVKTAKQWTRKRRGEILDLFRNEMYGKAPGCPEDMHFKLLSDSADQSVPNARRKDVAVYFDRDEKYCMKMSVYLPADAEGPVPAFMGMHFTPEDGIMSNLGMIISRGYGVATFERDAVDPDYYDGFYNGIFKLFYKEGQSYPEDNEWGTISAWAWAMSRAMDYLETDPDIDAAKVAAIGHSRLGKTALWAGANDERFALVISNDSGCGGAALSRRCFGENVRIITNAFPHWFCGNFFKYAGKEDTLPFDQHELIALIAPRPVYVASGSDDLWADPKGEFLSLKYASDVYRLFGYQGIPDDAQMPSPGGKVWSDRMYYHLRPGAHGLLPFDWSNYLDFADKYLK